MNVGCYSKAAYRSTHFDFIEHHFGNVFSSSNLLICFFLFLTSLNFAKGKQIVLHSQVWLTTTFHLLFLLSNAMCVVCKVGNIS